MIRFDLKNLKFFSNHRYRSERIDENNNNYIFFFFTTKRNHMYLTYDVLKLHSIRFN